MTSLLSLVVEYGIGLVFATTLAARVGLPVPAAPFLVVAGALGAGGQISWVGALAASIAGNIAGDGLWFWAGRRWGYRVLTLLCKISISPDSCVRQSEAFILRWGGSSLLAAKFVPGVSVVAPPMAGALGMSTLAFLGFETLGAAVWSGLLMGVGWAFAGQIQQVLDTLETLGIAAVGLLAVLAAIYLALRWWRRRLFMQGLAMPRIGVAELVELMNAEPRPIVVDVRTDAARTIDARRIPGAIGVGLADIERLAAQWSRDRELVLYCNCPNEASAASAARTLAAAGFTRARPLAGGLEAWVASGQRVELHVADQRPDAISAATDAAPSA
ncbi:MAG: VTT domain-containing protein [Burkholderiaceae bacterium]|nr:VTT domain-containing protein [Burkholderiaceae bacterium]